MNTTQKIYTMLAVIQLILTLAAVMALAFARHETFQDFMIVTLLINATSDSWFYKQAYKKEE